MNSIYIFIPHTRSNIYPFLSTHLTSQKKKSPRRSPRISYSLSDYQICYSLIIIIKNMINFEATELRLGLPGGNHGGEMAAKNNGKRGFSETVDLKLNLSSTAMDSVSQVDLHNLKEKVVKPSAKTQVVGWPPVRSFRKNVMSGQKPITEDAAEGTDKTSGSSGATSSASACATAAYVKVSMDGAPYLRKIDLKLYKTYQDLSNALSKMFSSFTIGNYGPQGMKDFMNESKLIDLLNGSDYVPTYEDKDGDWMLVGDVPWEMFVDSCKRIRIMKGSEAIGLAPRALEKCKNRS